MLIIHGWTIERARTVDADVVVIGERGERDVGPGDREHRDREQPVEAVRPAWSGYMALGKANRIAMPIADPIAATSMASATMQASRLLRVGEQLGEAAPQPERGDLRGELDRQHRIGKAAERGRGHRFARR